MRWGEEGRRWRLRHGGKAARTSGDLRARLPKPYNAATYRLKFSRRIPSILCFPTSNNEKHTKSQKTGAQNSKSCKELNGQVIRKNRPLGLASSVLLHNLIRIITRQPKLSRGITSHKFRSHVNPFAQLKLSNF